MRYFSVADLPAAPWGNGAGVTCEIARGPAADDGAWDWRLSVACIAQDGPFSSLPGIDRQSALLAGAVRLHTSGQTLCWQQLGQCHAYAGDAPAHARLLPSVRQAVFLNVMTRRGRASAQVQSHHGSAHLPSAHLGVRCFLVVRGRFGFRSADGQHDLAPQQGLYTLGYAPAIEVTSLAPHGCWLDAWAQADGE